MPEDYSMDEFIWNDGKNYFIEKNNFDINKKTRLPKGTELTVYIEETHISDYTCFATPNGNWIKY